VSSDSDGGVELVILDRASAATLLTSPVQCSEIAYLVSIGDPDDQLPPGYANVREKLRLEFSDSFPGPSERDIQALIDFAGRIASLPGTVLTHCHAGVSRSSAAAYIILCTVLGAGREAEALERVFSARSVAVPNRRMVEIADRLLVRDGVMVDVLSSVSSDG